MRSPIVSIVITALLAALAWPTVRFAESTASDGRIHGLELVGHDDLGDGELADIWVHGRTAFVGTDSCGDGVKVVDVSDPTRPGLIGILRSTIFSNYEDVIVIRADGPNFQGDLLATGLQLCRQGGIQGVEFWDVTRPDRPELLSFFSTGSRGVHELFMVQRENRILALLAVPFSEDRGDGGDFRILDVTDPRNPVQIADWGVVTDLGLNPETTNRGQSRSTYCHSAWANEEGTIAYLSYWDAGIILLDITDPSQPRFLGRTIYAPYDEGNAHSVWPAYGSSILLAADEDFTTEPAISMVHITNPIGLDPIRAVEGGLTRRVCDVGQINSEVAYAGPGCEGDSLSSDVRGKVALLESGGCSFREKILRVQREGAIAVMVIKPVSGPPSRMTGDPADVTLPGVMITQDDGRYLASQLAGGVPVSVTFNPNGWGTLRIYDVTDPARPTQIGSFATELSTSCTPPDDGWYTIHNPFVAGQTAYLSWYSDGVRVLDISDPAHPREVGYFVPPDRSPGPGSHGAKSLVWGVFVQDDLIYLSDINTGLYILKRQSE